MVWELLHFMDPVIKVYRIYISMCTQMRHGVFTGVLTHYPVGCTVQYNIIVTYKCSIETKYNILLRLFFIIFR